MPMLAFALRRIYEETKNKTLLEEFLPKVTEYYTWWRRDKQSDHDGLVVIIHPWES
jgi:glycogen debranching enzyme